MKYTFELHDGERPKRDDVWFTNRERALDHARTVARELMFGRELRCRSWSLDVYENDTLVREVRFANVDPTLDHLHPALRATVEEACGTVHGLKKTWLSTRVTMREARALVARSRGKPYLATVAGQPTIKTRRPVLDQNNRRRGSGQ